MNHVTSAGGYHDVGESKWDIILLPRTFLLRHVVSRISASNCCLIALLPLRSDPDSDCLVLLLILDVAVACHGSINIGDASLVQHVQYI
ncbi:unnamed protein product [Periconia digitata]|uniref:Uncharacterized protein n=1 Tax=Periconia digitata TaxID=1303443 RepID=A0A9W4XLZ9_9PLEO|nr:unnamed protein product [Periconia digitata]